MELSATQGVRSRGRAIDLTLAACIFWVAPHNTQPAATQLGEANGLQLNCDNQDSAVQAPTEDGSHHSCSDASLTPSVMVGYLADPIWAKSTDPKPADRPN